MTRFFTPLVLALTVGFLSGCYELEETTANIAKETNNIVVELYVETYSVETLRAYREFLETPSGQEIADKQTELVSLAFTKGEEIGEKVGMLAGQKITEDIQRDVWVVEGSDAAKNELRNLIGMSSPEEQRSE